MYEADVARHLRKLADEIDAMLKIYPGTGQMIAVRKAWLRAKSALSRSLADQLVPHATAENTTEGTR